MDFVFVDFDNKLVHELLFSEPGKKAVTQPFDLSGATEIHLQFFVNAVLVLDLNSNLNARIKVEDAEKGRVSYLPNRVDFNGVSIYKNIDGMRWVVKTSLEPRGVVFGDSLIKVRVVR